jgi:type IV secretory pathway VirD2 relaxase
MRAEGRDGQRLNPRKEDLRRWREVFAQRLRARGIEAEATPQCTRGARHLNERVWERKSMRWPLQAAGPQPMRMQMSPSL